MIGKAILGIVFLNFFKACPFWQKVKALGFFVAAKDK